jgi:hypothetical protein
MSRYACGRHGGAVLAPKVYHFCQVIHFDHEALGQFLRFEYRSASLGLEQLAFCVGHGLSKLDVVHGSTCSSSTTARAMVMGVRS